MSDVWCLETNTVNAYCWYEDVFTKDQLETIERICDALPLSQAKVKNQNSESVVSKARNSSIAWVPTSEEWIYRYLTDIIKSANDNWFGFDLRHVAALQYTVYEKGMYYVKHIDTMYQSAGEYPRKLSFSLQLSDPKDYKGGELLLHTGDVPVTGEKRKGSVTFFPSYTLHEVTPVTRGVRKCIVGWVHGPKWT